MPVTTAESGFTKNANVLAQKTQFIQREAVEVFSIQGLYWVPFYYGFIYIHVKNPRQTFFCITLSNFPCYHSPFHHWMRNHCQILEKIVDENTDYHFCRVLHNYTVATLGGEQDKRTWMGFSEGIIYTVSKKYKRPGDSPLTPIAF